MENQNQKINKPTQNKNNTNENSKEENDDLSILELYTSHNEAS